MNVHEDIKINPGQFIMIKSNSGPFLPKPFSVVNQKGNVLTLLIKKVGRLSNELSESVSGDIFFIKGVHGKGYYDSIDISRKYILLGAGCGSAPLMHFSYVYPDNVYKKLFAFKDSSVYDILEDDFFIQDERNENVIDYAISFTDNNTGIIASGGIAFLKAVKEKTSSLSHVYAVLDERMGCGDGYCKGCPVMTADGVKMVCKDGPLFDLKKLDLEWGDDFE